MLIAFRFNYRINQYLETIPENVSWINKGYYYIIRPHQLRHIGHFSECVNQLLLKLRFPFAYPPLTDLYLPEFKPNEYEWSKTYLSLVLSLFPEEYKPNLHLYQSITISPMTCFTSAVLYLYNINIRLY